MSEVNNIKNNVHQKIFFKPPFIKHDDLIKNIEMNCINKMTNINTEVETLDLNYNTKPTLKKIENNEVVTNLDEQIVVLETEKKELEKQIENLKEEINDEKWNVLALFFNNDKYNKDIEKLEKKLKKLEEQLDEKEEKIRELNQIKKANINYLTEIYYNKLQNNTDFKENTQINLTEDEARELGKLYTVICSSNTTDMSVVTATSFCNYENIKKYYDNNPILFVNQDIDWDIIENAYNNGFNIYEIAIQNPELMNETLSSVSSGPAFGDGYTLAEFAHMLNFMTQEEKNIFLYLYNTEGKDSANEYLTFKKQEFNSREGLYKASLFLENINDSSEVGAFLKTTLKGTTDGTYNFFEGMENAFGGMDGVVSVSQYETMYIINWMSESDIDKLEGFTEEEKEKLKELKGLSSNSFLQGTYEISSSIGNMLPSMMISTTLSFMGTPAAGKIVGTALMGLSSGGNAAESMYQQGYGFYESIHYGVLSGGSEALLGYFLGGIPGLSKLDNLPGVKGYIINMLMEGGEESLQAIIDPYLQSVALGIEQEINWEEVKKSGIYGMITAGLLNGGKIVTAGGDISVDSISQETINTIEQAESAEIEVDYNRISETNYIQQLKVTINYSNYNNLCNKLGITEKVDINTFYNNPESVVNEQMINKLNELSINNPDEIIKTFKEISTINPKISNELLLNADTVYMEILTNQLLIPALDYYDEAINFANSNNASAFKTYRTHCETHVKEVAELTLESAVAVSEVYKKDGYAEVNLYEVYIAALWHDVGMAAGSENIKAINANYNKKTGEYNPTVLKENKNGNDTRSNHTLNSALSILDNSQYFSEKLGVDPNVIALSVFAHSKSNSGIKNLTNADDWVTGIKILNDSYELYNNTYYPGKNKVSFIELCKNSGIIKNDLDEIVLTSKALSKLSANSFSLRLGDANTTTANVDTVYNQANKIITYDILEGSGLNTKKFLKEFDGSEKSVMQFLYEEYDIKYKIEDGKVKNIATDNESVIIKVDNEKTTADFHTIGFVLGENNITFNSSSKSPIGESDGMLHEICTIKNSDVVMPTIFNINERLGEVKSGISGQALENRASIDIVFPTETTSDIIECYKKASKTYLKADNIEYNFYIQTDSGNITKIK